MANATVANSKPRRTQPAAIKYYLVTYNALTLIAWAVVLYATVEFVLSPRHAWGGQPSTVNGSISGYAADTAKGKVLGWFSAATDVVQAYTKSSSSISRGSSRISPSLSTPFYASFVPAPLADLIAVVLSRGEGLVSRLSGAYAFQSPSMVKAFGTGLAPRLGPWTVLTQTGAVLEVLHAVLGWVRSDPLTVAMQVSSRLWMVWGIVERRPETQSHPLFTSMIFAWSVTEVIRCGFYLTSLIGVDGKAPIVKILTWLRYNTFYVLYPLGASSEAFLMASTLPSVRGLPRSLGAQLRRKKGLFGGMKLPGGKGERWDRDDLAVGALFLGWWPALYVLFTHMTRLRVKVFGKGNTLRGDKKAQ